MVRIVEKAMVFSPDAADALAECVAYLTLIRQMRDIDPSGSMWDATEDDVAGFITAMRALALGEVDVEEAVHDTSLKTLVGRLLGPQTALPPQADPETPTPPPDGRPTPV